MNPGDRRTLLIGGMLVFIVSIVCATLVAVAIDDGARATSMIALILGPLTSLIGIGVILAKVSGLDARVQDVAKDTNDLTNGLFDAKVRAAIVDVLQPHLIDGETHPEAQIQADRARRDKSS